MGQVSGDVGWYLDPENRREEEGRKLEEVDDYQYLF